MLVPGMLVRSPGAFHSQDGDLLHPGTDIIGAVDELCALSVHPDLDRFTFEIETVSLLGISLGVHRTRLGWTSGTTVTPHCRKDRRRFDAAALSAPIAEEDWARCTDVADHRKALLQAFPLFLAAKWSGSDSGS